MFGSLRGTRYDEPIEELIAMSDGQPADVGGSYKAQIVAMRQVGDAAIVTVEEGYWGIETVRRRGRAAGGRPAGGTERD